MVGKCRRVLKSWRLYRAWGHKTASVVLSQAFDIPAFAVDTHIFRLAARWGLSDGKNVVKTERDLKAVFPEKDWNKLHLQFIYFGREYCPALRHKPELCPDLLDLRRSRNRGVASLVQKNLEAFFPGFQTSNQ